MKKDWSNRTTSESKKPILMNYSNVSINLGSGNSFILADPSVILPQPKEPLKALPPQHPVPAFYANKLSMNRIQDMQTRPVHHSRGYSHPNRKQNSPAVDQDKKAQQKLDKV